MVCPRSIDPAMKRTLFSAAVFAAMMSASEAAMVITEWLYSGNDGEFIEFTNTGAEPVNLAGWSYDDSGRTPGLFDLSPLGVVLPGQSVIITEAAVDDFRAAWGLDASVAVLSGYTRNLGRNDEINLYNGTDLVDRLTFGDQDFSGSIRTQNVSGVTGPENYGLNDVSLWTLSATGDGFSVTSAGGDVGSPGIAAIPEPSASLLAGVALASALVRRRR